jgi:hypothetical protein
MRGGGREAQSGGPFPGVFMPSALGDSILVPYLDTRLSHLATKSFWEISKHGKNRFRVSLL